MGLVDDLNAAVTQLSTDVQAGVAEVKQLQANGDLTGAVQTAITTLNSLDANVKQILPAAPAAAPADGAAPPPTGS